MTIFVSFVRQKKTTTTQDGQNESLMYRMSRPGTGKPAHHSINEGPVVAGSEAAAASPTKCAPGVD
ncbi:hypothetical protein QDX21_05130 [Auritidibacter ignavus]|uniref:Uncharacterized protein n=1 Tax=Auritidibacter ignavus TaxID=678932 RepID=A0AAJ6ANS6_9MICC|nr:hypothetical protein [Auritidibacter ignavus]WGH94178.1 hypothetical protein QDX21_05130 [Auritidibacter ignavus]